MRLVVDELACDGHGKCERIARDLFKMEQGVARVLVEGELTAAQIPVAKVAVQMCPTKAIHLIGANGPGESQ